MPPFISSVFCLPLVLSVLLGGSLPLHAIADELSEIQTANPSEPDKRTPEEKKADAEALAKYEREVEERVSEFNQSKATLAESMGVLREIMIRYVNDRDHTPSMLRQRDTQRLAVRKLLDETYSKALEVIRIGFDEEAASFVLTMVQHRHEQSIYDLETAEGAARLIDQGSEYLFLYLCGARSAVVSGKYDMAKNLYDVISEDEMEDVDRALRNTLKLSEENYLQELESRKRDDEAGDQPRVLIETTQGDVLVELYLKEAPTIVSHFLRLVKDGFYDELDFFQVIDDVLALTGDPTGLGDTGCGKFLMDEHEREDARVGLRGSLVMAKKPRPNNRGFYPNSASSQFAILYLPVPGVNDQQTVFGRVIEGENVVSRLRRVDASKKKDKKKIQSPPDRVVSITIVRAPEELPEPQYFDLQAAIQKAIEKKMKASAEETTEQSDGR